MRQTLLRQEAEAEAQRLVQHRDALLDDLERLRSQLATWKGRCHILDPSLANAGPPRALRGLGRCRGFQHVDQVLPLPRRRVAA